MCRMLLNKMSALPGSSWFIPDNSSNSEWVLNYFHELFPETVLYFLVVIFHVRATSSPLSALVLGYGVHSMSECTIAHLYWEWSTWISICGAASDTCFVWHMELRLLSFCYPTILCEQQNQNCSCTCTGVYCGILSHLSHSSHLWMHKTPWQQL